MTVIEFLDSSPVANIASTLLLCPERVIFVGGDETAAEATIEVLKRLMALRCIDTELSFVRIDGGSHDIANALDALLTECDDAVFDVTGGSETYLLALGILTERYGERIRYHRFDATRGVLTEYVADKHTIRDMPLHLTVEESIILCGGQVESRADTLHLASEGEEAESFLSDCIAMWRKCNENPKLWNSLTSVLAKLNNDDDPSPTRVCASHKLVLPALRNFNLKQAEFVARMKELRELGLISSFFFGDEITFRYKSESVKRCLTVAGQILELATAASLATLRDDAGRPLFCDVAVGVTIDWDSEAGDAFPTYNEIDVMAMRGATPNFISCKNGVLDIDELYKLWAVKTKFGTNESRAILVTQDLSRQGTKASFIRARAEDMGIAIIDEVNRKSADELQSEFKSLWEKITV
ncbi:MAG: DUF1887 family protein [Clostridia bacterium]|nr:DUF1887 family protein [Clostridia bacterium]